MQYVLPSTVSLRELAGVHVEIIRALACFASAPCACFYARSDDGTRPRQSIRDDELYSDLLRCPRLFLNFRREFDRRGLGRRGEIVT